MGTTVFILIVAAIVCFMSGYISYRRGYIDGYLRKRTLAYRNGFTDALDQVDEIDDTIVYRKHNNLIIAEVEDE